MGYTKEQREANRLDRLSREQESREADEIHESYDDWGSDYLLDTSKIPARPGYVQRWIRTGMKGEDDRANVFKKMNKGWKPRLLNTVPKAQQVLKQDFNGDEVIGIHGMILMERPDRLHERQSNEVKRLADLQMEAVKSDLFKVHERGDGFSRPEFSNNSRVKRGRSALIDD